MPKDGWDVNVEYEKLFGSAKQVNLFDTEEEYNELRKYIIGEPQVTYTSKALPFEGIVITSVEKTKQKIEDRKKPIVNDFLPEQKTGIEIKEKPKRQRIPKFFFIIRENMGKRSCYAKGSYNKNNKSFTILKDSELTFDVTSSYLYTASDIKRKMIIKKQCLQSKTGYRLIEDLLCKNPDEAARYVLGDLVTGCDEWKSKDGLPLSEYTKQV